MPTAFNFSELNANCIAPFAFHVALNVGMLRGLLSLFHVASPILHAGSNER